MDESTEFAWLKDVKKGDAVIICTEIPIPGEQSKQLIFSESLVARTTKTQIVTDLGNHKFKKKDGSHVNVKDKRIIQWTKERSAQVKRNNAQRNLAGDLSKVNWSSIEPRYLKLIHDFVAKVLAKRRADADLVSLQKNMESSVIH